MSSRALRKLQGGSDLLSPDLLNGADDEPDESDVCQPVPVAKKKNKKKKAVDLPANPFDLVCIHDPVPAGNMSIYNILYIVGQTYLTPISRDPLLITLSNL